MDQIIIKDLLARGIIGVNDSERTQPQDILINIVMFVDLHRAGKTDNIDDTVSYRTVAKDSMELAITTHHFTVEALANDIAEMVLAQPLITSVRVRVEKPGAVRFSRSVGVEIERSKTD